MSAKNAGNLYGWIFSPGSVRVSRILVTVFIIAMGNLMVSSASATDATGASVQEPARLVIHKVSKTGGAVRDTIALARVTSISFSRDANNIRDPGLFKPTVCMIQGVRDQRILLTGNAGGSATLRLITLQGKTVLLDEFRFDATGRAVRMIPAIPAGIYFVRYITGSTIITQKVNRF